MTPVHGPHCPETSLGPPGLLPPCLVMGNKCEGFSAVEGPREGIEGSSRSRDRESCDGFFHLASPDGGRDCGAATTRHDQCRADSEPRHRAMLGQREGSPLHGSSACRPRHGLFAHANKRALAKHVLLSVVFHTWVTLSGWGAAPGAMGRGKGARFCSRRLPRWDAAGLAGAAEEQPRTRGSSQGCHTPCAASALRSPSPASRRPAGQGQ